MPALLLTDSAIFALRQFTEDCEVSRLCSAALWAPRLSDRSRARNKLARMVAL